MSRSISVLVILALVTGLIESGLDASGTVASDDHAGAAHEVHGHLGQDESPAGDDDDVEHFCHCATHVAALAFTFHVNIDQSGTNLTVFRPADYRSLAIPPPVPPPNA